MHDGDGVLGRKRLICGEGSLHLSMGWIGGGWRMKATVEIIDDLM